MVRRDVEILTQENVWTDSGRVGVGLRIVVVGRLPSLFAARRGEARRERENVRVGKE